MPQFEVWDTETQKLVFLEEAPDLEVAIARAKDTVRGYTNYDSIDPEKLLVCLATGENVPDWAPPAAG
jgi:hypothetical protein